METKSVSIQGSKVSKVSTTCSLAAQKRAKAEASRARAQFARKEFELLKRKATLEEEKQIADAKVERLKSEYDAELLLLAEEKEAAADEAEANVFETEIGLQSCLSDRGPSPTALLDLPSQKTEIATQEYVANLPLEKNADKFSPKTDENPSPINHPCSASHWDFDRFLLKKDLLLSRLSQFNEEPESFEAWRSSFKTVIKDLQVSPQEELDLLIKHLGPESRRYAINLRAANHAHPERGLELLLERLHDRYGSPELVESCLKTKLERFPQLTNKDNRKLYDLCDLLDQILCAKQNPNLSTLFAVYDSSAGVNTIIRKLPHALRQKWVTDASRYKKERKVPFPPFTFLVDFMRNLSKEQNDPAFCFDDPEKKSQYANERSQPKVLNRKAHVSDDPTVKCPIHKTRHSLMVCKAFRAKSWHDRVSFLKDQKICFKCLSSTDHTIKECTVDVKCEKCGKGHCTAMHRETAPHPSSNHGGENLKQDAVLSKCTSLCSDDHSSRSCGKIILVRVFPEGKPEKSIKVYAVIDDQSNRSLATPALLDQLGVSSEEIVYTLSSCSGTRSMSGRHVQNLCVQSLDGQKTMSLPSLIECESIPGDRSEIPSPEVAQYHRHLNEITGKIPHIDARASIGLLIGRDLPEAHHVLQQVIGPPLSPFAQRLPLGWVIVGNVCLGKVHRPSKVVVNKMYVTHLPRETLFEPCPNHLRIKEVNQVGARVFEKTAQDVKNFVSSNLSVDDGATSLPRKEEAVSLVKRTQTTLQEQGKLRLHKIASSSRDILTAFPVEDLCDELKSVDLSDPSVPLPVHHCLGLPWNLNTDAFVIRPQLGNSPFTRRGILSTLNSIYDPLGFLAPAVISGKILLREISPNGTTWDEPLSTKFRQEWEQWKQSMQSLQDLEVPRMCVPVSMTKSSNLKFHIFCDASEKAIASVAYVQVIDGQDSHLGFVMGKAKVAPSGGHTIPRLELCSAVLATELWQLMSEQLNVASKNVTFYTDSKVVLGYINNETRRFYTYVSNRVECIRKVTDPTQWKYVPTEFNPADAATRCVMEDVSQKVKTWLRGPKDFLKSLSSEHPLTEVFPLVSPNEDTEVRPCVRKTQITHALKPLTFRFQKFSCWNALISALCFLQHICDSFHSPSESCKGWHLCSSYRSVDGMRAAEIFVIKAVQSEAFSAEIESIRKGESLSKSSSIISLSPFLDEKGILRVGGRICNAKEAVGWSNAHPVLLPKNHHVSALLIQHYHGKVKHQGRHFTEGALRSAGFWIIGAKKHVSSVIQQCFLCKRLRGKFAEQQMANLPAQRVLPSAPFSHVGVDVFGPWTVLARKTRGGLANAKRWAVIFTCMAIRAIHIEVLEEMSSSSFINALRRFVALRGPVTELHSDRGTNFVGAAKELGANAHFAENEHVRTQLLKSGMTWKFNPPHASHMGGSWERLIGVVRKILDSMLLDVRQKPLTHEMLCTLMAEICAIVNSRPITPISHDPDFPHVLTPSMLLTMKSGQQQVACESTDLKETYKKQWKYVQILSNIFWKNWKNEYLQSLQQRRKWKSLKPNIKEGDLVLLKDMETHRTTWPIGLVTRTFPSQSDNLVRSAEVRVIKDQKAFSYVRPISHIVPL